MNKLSSVFIKDYMFVIRAMRKLKIKRIKDPGNPHKSKIDIYVRDLVFSYYHNRVYHFKAVENIHKLKFLLERKIAFKEVACDKDYESTSFVDSYHPCYPARPTID